MTQSLLLAYPLKSVLCRKGDEEGKVNDLYFLSKRGENGVDK